MKLLGIIDDLNLISLPLFGSLIQGSLLERLGIKYPRELSLMTQIFKKRGELERMAEEEIGIDYLRYPPTFIGGLVIGAHDPRYKLLSIKGWVVEGC